jgi:hypothetical protein
MRHIHAHLGHHCSTSYQLHTQIRTSLQNRAAQTVKKNSNIIDKTTPREIIIRSTTVHRQNVEVTNAESAKRRTTKRRKTKCRMGQNVEWKKRRMG